MANEEGTIVAISVSRDKGVAKTGVNEAKFVAGHGIENDAHAGPWIRQISLLAMESIQKLEGKVAPEALAPGSFAENITTRGIIVATMMLGTRLAVGKDVVLEITKIGKECHARCAIYEAAGDCVMPREGVFAKVIAGGIGRPGDTIRVIHD